MRQRAGIILIRDDQIALIERHRAGMHYFIFPGGGMDEGESAEDAAIREAEEELGIKVEIKQKIAEIIYKVNKQYYFLVDWVDGDFGTGTGEEYGEYDPAHGTYLPLWMPIDEITEKNVLPKPLAEIVKRAYKDGWPGEPVTIVEENN